MIRLYIENQEMDVTEGFSHQITYAVDDLQNLDSKATAFSKTIVLPGTSRNNTLLGNIFEFSNSNFTGLGENVGYNFNASKSAKSRLEINGLTIIKGALRLLEIIRDGDSIEYEVAIFGELGGFFSTLSNKKLQDLDFGMYDHPYNINTIDNYWSDASDLYFYTDIDTVLFNGSPDTFAEIYKDVTNYVKSGDIIEFLDYYDNTSYGDRTITNVTWDGNKTTIIVSAAWSSPPGSSFKAKVRLANKKGFGVYYPLIDYGNYSTNKIDYKIKTFRPALHVYEYMDKIINGAGYTWESKFFETDFFKRLIIPHAEATLKSNISDLYKGNFYGGYQQVNASSFSFTENANIQKYLGDSFTTTNNQVFTYTGGNTTAIFNFDLSLRVNAFRNRLISIDAEIYRNGTGTGIIKSYSGYPNTPPSPQFNYKDLNATFSFINESVILNTNDTFEIKFTIQVTSTTSIYTAVTVDIYNTEIDLNSEFPVLANINIGDTVELNQTIPKNILQKDFFASILKMFYLMVTEDKYKEKHLIIEPWTWFYNLNSTSYVDWTMKLDRSQPIKIKPMSEANARFYDIKFKADTDYYNDFYKKKYNEGYGDVRYDNELEFAKDASTTEVIFSSTPLLGYVGIDKIVPTIMKWDGKTTGVNEESVNSNIRIMQKKGVQGVTEWNVLNDSGTIITTYTKYPYAGHFDDPDAPGSDINFGATKELFFSLDAGALGNNLFNTFYSSYLAEITDKDSRLVTAKFKLNDTDIFNLDFGRFIYLDGVLYRLSRVVDYTPGEICTVELLRVIYTTYDNSVNAAPDPEIFINGLVWEGKNYEGEYYRNGDAIPQITDEAEWEATTDGAWCYYENNTANGVEYGKLYNWYAVNDPRGLGPEGWRLPTEAELYNLGTYAGGGNALKEIGTEHWTTANGTDDFGFTALGAGRRRYTGAYEYLKTYAYYWTSEEYDTDEAYYARIQDASNTFNTDKIDKNTGFSIRLVKDI